jgi:hypothetical protein
MILSLSTSVAAAQNPTACAQVLQPDVVKFQQDTRIQIAYLDTISEQRYNEAKTSGTIDVVVPVQGTPVDNKGTYDQFHQSLEDYKHNVRYSLNRSDSVSYYSSRVSTDKARFFVECMRSQASNGLFLYVAQEADEDGNLVLAVEWRPASGIKSDINLAFDLGDNASAPGAPTSVPINGSRQFSVRRRDVHHSITITANGSLADGSGSYPASFRDPGAPPYVPPPPVLGACMAYIGESRLLLFEATDTDEHYNPGSGVHPGEKWRDTIAIDSFPIAHAGGPFTAHLSNSGLRISGTFDQGVGTFVITVNSGPSLGTIGGSVRCSADGITGTLRTTTSAAYWHTWDVTLKTQ